MSVCGIRNAFKIFNYFKLLIAFGMHGEVGVHAQRHADIQDIQDTAARRRGGEVSKHRVNSEARNVIHRSNHILIKNPALYVIVRLTAVGRHGESGNLVQSDVATAQRQEQEKFSGIPSMVARNVTDQA